MATYLNADASDSNEFFFISYKKENQDILKSILPNLDFNFWYDGGIRPDELWESKIVSKIKNCQGMILFLSKEVFQSGPNPFVKTEYKIAREVGKNVLIVFLDDIPFQDVPDSLIVWKIDIESHMYLPYLSTRTTEELIREINSSVIKMIDSKRKATQTAVPVVKQLNISCCSSFNQHKLIYVGFDDMHISSDNQLICLYATENKMYEIRKLDDLDYIVARFKCKQDAIKHSRIFYTPHNTHLFFVENKILHFYNIYQRTWADHKELNARLDSKESVYALYDSLDPHLCYWLIQKKQYISKIIRYNFQTYKVECIWNVEQYRITGMLRQLKNSSKNYAMFTNEDSKIIVLDLESCTSQLLTYNDLKQFLEQDEYIFARTDNYLSHDGQLYSSTINNNINVINTLTGGIVFNDYTDRLHDLYLLNNQTVLRLEKNGNVIKETKTESHTVFDSAFFKQFSFLAGAIPHTLYYDELNENYIFVSHGEGEKQLSHTVFVINNEKQLIMLSNEFVVPFQSFACICRIVRGKLMVFFNSTSEKKSHEMQTVIFTGDYRHSLIND